MLRLLAPAAGLLALAALLVPLGLHLWRLPVRTIRLGSLRAIRATPGRPRVSLRWRERALLLARLGLLASLALLLARPWWQERPPAGPQRWALLDPTAELTGEPLARWRTLAAEGFVARSLRPGFPPARATGRPDAEAEAGAADPDVWSLLREADARLPAGSRIVVFAPRRLASLRGVRPVLGHCQTGWVNVPATGGDVAQTPAGSRAQPERVKPLDVMILHAPDRREDARYLAAALRAAAGDRGMGLKVVAGGPTAADFTGPQWVFCLGQSPGTAVPAPANLWTDAPAGVAAEPVASHLVAPADAPGVAALTDGAVRLWRRVPPAGGAAVWTDAAGSPLLTVSATGPGQRWQFSSRFHPDWNDLPRSSALADVLRDLLFPTAPPDPAHDRRLASPDQCRPAESPAPVWVFPLVPAPEEGSDAHLPLWALAVGLFALERTWSRRRATGPGKAAPVASPSMTLEGVGR